VLRFYSAPAPVLLRFYSAPAPFRVDIRRSPVSFYSAPAPVLLRFYSAPAPVLLRSSVATTGPGASPRRARPRSQSRVEGRPTGRGRRAGFGLGAHSNPIDGAGRPRLAGLGPRPFGRDRPTIAGHSQRRPRARVSGCVQRLPPRPPAPLHRIRPRHTSRKGRPVPATRQERSGGPSGRFHQLPLVVGCWGETTRSGPAGQGAAPSYPHGHSPRASATATNARPK